VAQPGKTFGIALSERILLIRSGPCWDFAQLDSYGRLHPDKKRVGMGSFRPRLFMVN
jgi:hypothetical protein